MHTKINKLELEEYNFKVNSSKWSEIKINCEKMTINPDFEKRTFPSELLKCKINPEGDIIEILEWIYIGEQLFTWGAAMRETKKELKTLPSVKEIKRIIQSKHDLKNITYPGDWINNMINGDTITHYGISLTLWTRDCDVNLNISNIVFERNNDFIFDSLINKSTIIGSSVRCLQK